MAATDVLSVATLEPIIHSFLNEQSEPPIGERECAELIAQVKNTCNEEETASTKSAALETIFRDTFDDLVANTEISSPAFSRVWILLDLVNTFSDHELCEPGFSFYLVENLLDSQTIDGCRKVFDYLESRRERMTTKHFKQKNLVILRCCNELLRRLSRAEDTVFCGRVFIFLFQSFPLGDRSSVNLRGEFHVENVTTFDPVPKKSEKAIKPMEVDIEVPAALPSEAATPGSSAHDTEQPSKTSQSTPSAPKQPRSERKTDEPPPDMDALYPVFWSLQSYFSSPTRLFEPASMSNFKEGMKLTLSCFKSVSSTTVSTTNGENPLKRKRSTTSHPYSTFNPKYLTNRDLFDLEIHDLSFRRHILVQSLIMLDFLLSLTPASKTRSSTNATNKSVQYTHTLSDSDAQWCASTRSSIASYLQQSGPGNEGKFYYRMVDTVLSRDKNWVRWKAESCPIISRPPIDPKTHLSAQQTLTKLCAKQHLPAPPGATELEFLNQVEALDSLKHPSKRMKVPTMQEYVKGMETDDLDMDFAGTEEEKKELEERRAGRVWRALRASKRRFVLCEQIENGANLKALLGQSNVKDEDGHAGKEHEKRKEEDGGSDKENGVAGDETVMNQTTLDESAVDEGPVGSSAVEESTLDKAEEMV